MKAIRKGCEAVGRDPAEIGIRASLTSTDDWDAAPTFEARLEQAIATGLRLGAVGVTHFNVPLNYYLLDLDSMGALLHALRQA